MSAPTYNPQAPSQPPSSFRFDPVPEAIEAIKRGEFVVVMDDESRENEGDVICAGSKITQEGMAWMVKWTSGYICISMPPERLEQLRLPPLVALSGSSEDPKGTAYHLTLDANNARHPVTTGISAHDRSYAINLLAQGSGPDEFTRPGHLVTLRYTKGGVVKRRGHTEAAVDLCYLADEHPTGVLCELVNPDDPKGEMARRDDCWRFAQTWGLKIISIEELAEYAEKHGKESIPGLKL